MAMWELALLMFAATYMVVNILYMVYMMKFMGKFTGMIDKSVAFTEKMMDTAMKEMEDE